MITKRLNKLNTNELIYVFQNNDIVCLTEVWGDPSQCFDVDGFTHYELHRQEKKLTCTRNSGGIIIYVRNEFVSADTLFKKCNDTHIWLKLKHSIFDFENDVYLCLCYISPSNSSRQGIIDSSAYDEILQNILHIKNITNDACNIILVGDLNSRIGQDCDYVADDSATHLDVLPDDYIPDHAIPRSSQDQITNANGKLLLELLKQTGLRVANGRVCEDKHIGSFTFVGSRGSSLVDYCIVNPDLLSVFTSFYVHDPNIISDHCLIEFSLVSTVVRQISDNKAEEASFSYYKWNSSNKDEYINNISTEQFQERLNVLIDAIDDASCSNDIDVSISTFSDLMHNVCDPLFSMTKHANKSNDTKENTEQYSFDRTCSDKRKIFYRFLNTFRKNKNDENRVNMVRARTEYKNAVRKFNLERDRQKSFKLLNAKVKNAKEYWKLLKNAVSQPKSKNISITDFENYFKAVNNPDDPFFQPDEDVLYFNERFLNKETQVMFDELNVIITVEEIRRSIYQLKNGRSGGPDKFLNEFFIHGSSVLLPYLYSLFNKILNLGYFPESWSEGYIIPLHKKGKLDDVNNFRGITLLSVLGKLFSRILNNRLTEWAEEYYVYIEAQAGFRKCMGTIDNIFVLHGLINHTLNKNENLFCAFVDFTKAFDYVVRDILWYKLIKMGVRGKILNVVMSMYKHIKSQVKLDCNISMGFNCELGVRQGECLSPFLFAMYLNDLEDELYLKGSTGVDVGMFKMFLLLYADDIIIFANTAEELQNNLDILAEYCNRNRLVVNTLKTKVMVFRRGGILPRDMKFYYNNVELDIVKKFSYLGIIFSTGGSFSECQETLAGQGMKAIFKLNKLLYNFTNITPKHRIELFDKLVTPILNYGCEVWGFCQANKIERTHMMFCKQLLGVKTSTQNDFVYGEFGRTNYYSRRLSCIIKYWFKVVHAGDRKNVKILYNLMLTDLTERPNTQNWAALVKICFLIWGSFMCGKHKELVTKNYF